MMGIVNGWDNVVDSNDGKTFLGSLAITPVEQFALLLNGIYGAEQPDRGDSKRGVFDAVATVKPDRQLRDHPELRLRPRERSPRRS
jgi:hypothetical protein